MELKVRIVGIIIKDSKLLMVKGRGYKELWTPGGKIELGESDEQCLRRELKEEIKVELKEMKFFNEYSRISFYHQNHITTQRLYITSVSGMPKPNAEIEEIVWLSKEDFRKKRYPMVPITEQEIIPDLIKQGIF